MSRVAVYGPHARELVLRGQAPRSWSTPYAARITTAASSQRCGVTWLANYSYDRRVEELVAAMQELWIAPGYHEAGFRLLGL